MINRFVIYPPRVGCEEVQRLKNSFLEAEKHCFIAKRDGVYSPQDGDFIIGWGYSREPIWASRAQNKKLIWLNHYLVLLNSIKKLTTFKILANNGINIPLWTIEKEKAQQWKLQGSIVLARNTETGCHGEGINIILPNNTLPDALFYTQFIPNEHEYRVYVINNRVVDVLEKRKLSGRESNPFIKGAEEYGWCFCRQNVSLSTRALALSVKATKVLNLDFCGVDLVTSNGEPFVLEVNTAPDIFGTGVKIFRDAFINLAKEL